MIERRRSRWDSPLAAVLFFIALAGALLASYYVKSLSNRVTRIERIAPQVTQIQREVRTVEHRQTLLVTPCLQGSDRLCRLFIDRLLRAASRTQLRKLRGAPHVSIRTLRRLLSSPRVRRKLHVRPLPRRHRPTSRGGGSHSGSPPGHGLHGPRRR